MKRLPALTACLLTLGTFEGAFAQSVDGQRLADGVRVPVRLMQRLSSETAKTGDQVTFEVVEDVVVNNGVVIRRGTPARGTIVTAAERRRMGRAGKLAYALSETKTVDQQTIRLRATQQSTGGSNVTSTAVTTTAVAVFIPVAAPFVLLRRGKDVIVAEGTRIDAFVDGEHLLQSGAARPADAPPQSPTVAVMKLTNGDILNLKAGGFGDAVILAKIAGSPNDFSLAPSDLLELKKAGISETVITAMLNAKR